MRGWIAAGLLVAVGASRAMACDPGEVERAVATAQACQVPMVEPGKCFPVSQTMCVDADLALRLTEDGVINGPVVFRVAIVNDKPKLLVGTK